MKAKQVPAVPINDLMYKISQNYFVIYDKNIISHE